MSEETTATLIGRNDRNLLTCKGPPSSSFFLMMLRILPFTALATIVIGLANSTATTLPRFDASDNLIPGQIISRVTCRSNPDQSYALYLPTTYSSNRKWALIAAFDPGARGTIPVERFREAAERYGYIVCGSNNSRNGPMRDSAEAAKAMLSDVAARFAIDEKQVYVAGFSGGARAASSIAVWLSDQIAGVIGCGAGFSEGISISSSLPFIYYGTAGFDDFNYPELKKLDRDLEQAHVVHRLAEFDGGHEWAPSAECVRAIEWLDLQAMKSGRRARDEAFIDRVFKSANEQASVAESEGNSYAAYLAYKRIVADFRGVRDITDVEKRASTLEQSKSVMQAIKKELDQEDEQIRRARELLEARYNLSRPRAESRSNSQYNQTAPEIDTNANPLSDLKSRLVDLKKKSESKTASPERSLARRVLNQFLITSFEESRGLIQSKHYKEAAARLAIDAEILPDNPRISYNLACAYALSGDKRHAIEALNKAVQKGFTNTSALESDPELSSLREDPGFKKIVETLKTKK